MYRLLTLFSVYLCFVHVVELIKVPTSSEIRHSKVIYHRKRVCMLRPGQETCFNTEESRDPEIAAKVIKMHRFENERPMGDVSENRVLSNVYNKDVIDTSGERTEGYVKGEDRSSDSAEERDTSEERRDDIKKEDRSLDSAEERDVFHTIEEEGKYDIKREDRSLDSIGERGEIYTSEERAEDGVKEKNDTSNDSDSDEQ